MPPWVFPSRTGTAVEERNLRHVFTRMLEKAELRQIRIHDLRHSMATQLLQAGALITYVSQQLGHADAAITLRVYAHYLPDASRKEVDLLDTQPAATPAQPAPEMTRRRKVAEPLPPKATTVHSQRASAASPGAVQSRLEDQIKLPTPRRSTRLNRN